MKQSTFSAVMANKLLTVLQGYTKGIRFVAVLTLLFTIGVGQIWADYTITFKSNTSSTDGSTAQTTITNLISSGNANVSSVSAAYAYNGKTGYGVKLGSSSNAGNVTMNLATSAQIKASKLVVSAAYYDSGKTLKVTVTYTDNTTTTKALTPASSITAYDVALTTTKTIKTIKVESVTASKGRMYCSSIKVVAVPTAAWKLKGSWDGWTEHAMTVNGTEATCQIDLAKGQEYEFGFDDNGTFYKNNGAIITDISGWGFSTDANNARLYTGPAGTYTFKINTSTKQVQVIYPTVTHPAEGYAYFQKQDSWNGFKVYNYTSDTERLSDWPGSPSVTNTTTICGKTYYYTALATQFQKVIFRDNGSNQWKEISVSGYSGKYCGDDYNATPQTWKTFNKYSITYNANGGTGTMTNVSGICPGDKQTLAANSYTKAGHDFAGWATSASGNVVYADEATIFNINSNITLYAKWTPKKYTITSNLTNCSSSPAIPSSYTYTGSAANLTYTITPSTGYALPDAVTVSGTTYTWDKATGKLTLTGTISSNVTITVTAKKVYTITWKVNKQTYTTGTPSTTVYEGSTYKNLTLPTAPADGTLNDCYPGKKFVGWSTDNIGSTESDKPSILFKSTSEAPSTAITENKTLYAVFATEKGGGTSTVSLFSEDFSSIQSGDNTSTTGSSNAWTKNNNFYSVSAAYQAGGAVRLGTSSATGNLVTKQLTAAIGETLTISFKVKGWSSVEGNIQVSGNNSEFAQPSAISYTSKMSGSFETKSVSVVLTKANPYIKIATTAKRAFIDDIQITKTTSSAPTYSNYVTECCTLNDITLDGSGTVTGGTFSATATKACKGEEITLSATADECYAFTAWTIKKTSDGSDVTSSVLSGNTLTMPDYAVTVSAAFKSLSVTEIALAMTDGHQNLDIGQTNQLLVTYTPKEATCDKAIVSWTSSDDNVMSVSNTGLVTAERAGNATITAKTENGVTATYTITVNNPACASWFLHYWNQTTGGDECFYKVKPDDANDHEWRTNNFSLPSNSDEDKFIVNNTPEDQYKTDQIFRTGIGFADIQRGGQNCGTNPYPGQDALGQLSIYDDSNTPNRYIAFYPAQYLVTYGKEGAASWEVLPFKNTTGYEYETEPFMVPNGYKTDDTYKYYVGIINHHGNIMHVADKSSADAMNTVNGLSSNDMAGKWGTWHIYSNSCDANWYCEFISYYRVDFDLNGGEGDFAPRYGKATEHYVKFTTTDIGAPTRDGYKFLGWKDQNNKIYAPTGATVTINNDYTLTALWIEEYPSNNCRWEEVTIDDIEYGDEVVIATVKNGFTYALKDNDGGASSAPRAVQLTINPNNTINTSETSISTPLIWNIDYDKEGTKNLVIYSTKNTGKWLYSINNNNGIRIGDNTDKEFKIVEGTGNDAGNYFLYHIAQGRYLGVYYPTPDWRGYTTINSYLTGQTLKFYKKVCLDPTRYWVTWDANGGAWSDGSTKKEEIHTVGATISAPAENPTRDGYQFAGWNPTPGTMTEGNKTFTAQWAELHTITWMVGSTTVWTEEVANGTGVTETPTDDPTDDAIGDCADKFMGWSELSSGSTPQDEDYYSDLCTAAQMKAKHTSVTEDKTFYAVFATSEETTGGTVEASLSFASTDQRTSWSKYKQVWEQNEITFTHDKANGADIVDNINPIRCYKNSKITVAHTSNEITEIVFDCNSNDYAGDLKSSIGTISGAAVSSSSDKVTVTFTNAVASFTVTLSSGQVRLDALTVTAGGGTITNYSDYVTQCCTDWTPTFTYDKSTLDANTNETATPTISGNDHGANVTFVSSNPSVLTVDAANGKITAEGAGRATVTATWEKTGDYCDKSVTSNEITVNGNFTVTFHKNDGSNETSTQQVPSNTATALNANTFQREGYTFQGWAISANGNVAYTDGQQVTLTTAGLNLYAVWKINSYKITTTTAHGTVTTSPANQANYNAQVTITTTPDAHYTVSSIVVTRDDNSQSVTVTNNKFTMPASDVTVTVVFTENPKYNIIYNIPTGGGELVDGYPTFIYSDGSITLPNLKSGSISNEYSCEEFIGWTTNSATHEAAGLKPDPFYAIGASLSGITQNTTLYAVYSRAGNGLGGTVTLTATEMEGWATAQSYGTERDLTTCVGTWKTTGVKSTGNPIQIKDSYYVQFPELQGNITQVVLNATNGSNATLTSGTFTLKTIDGQTITSASVNSSGVCTLTVTGSHKTARLYSSVTARIANISISYGPAAIISTTLSCTNDIDECTVTYDLNESFLAVGTKVLGSCTNSTFRFSEIGEYTICSEPQANEYRLIGWNNQCDGKGSLTFTPGQVISSLPQNIITLYAQWVPEVIVHDSYEETKVYPTEMGGSITLNPGQYICDPQKYEFIGWTAEDPQLWQQQNISPTLLEENQDGTVTFTPTEPSQVYAVYAIEDMANSDAFRLSLVVNGNTYYLGYASSRIKATTIDDAFVLYKETINASASQYRMYYVDGNSEKQYVYCNSVGNVGTSDNPNENWGWTITKSGTGYTFTSINYTSGPNMLKMNESNVSMATSGSVFNMETVAEYKYVAKTNCSETVTITFVPGNGTMTPSTNPVTAKTGDVITLPTCEYEGWTFLGWVTENIEITEFEIDPSRLYNGNYEVGNSDVTLYAYYTQIPESAEFDGTTSEVYKMYCEVDDKYYYAISHGSSRPGTLPSSNICLNAEEWVFTNTGEANVYYIQDHNNLYLTPEVNNTQLFFTSTPFPWKVVEIGTTNTYRIYAYNTRNDDYSRLIMFQSGAFYHSAKNNESNSAWHHVTIGGCQNPVYTTDPQPSKVISLVGSPMITSTINQTVKASQQLQFVLKDMEANTSVTIAGDGLTFYDADNNEVTTLQTGPNGSLTATLTVAYTPTVADNQIVNPAITVTCGSASRTFYNVTCRSLPATFVIAAKVGGIWYALPSQGLNSTDALVGYPVEVDNLADPTAVTAVPANADWSLRQVYASTQNLDRFKAGGHNLVFVNNVSPEKALNPSSTGNYLLTNAQYDNYHNATTPGLYEWTPTTSDLETYQLTNVQQTTKKVNINTNTVFGVHASDVVTTDVRFLPIQQRYTPLAAQVVEWKENSVVIMYNGDPAQTASVSVNGGSAQTTTLSSAQKDIAVYELTANGLAAKPTQSLSITIGSEKVILPIPYIIGSATDDATILGSGSVAAKKEIAKVADLVVLNGGKLTANGAASGPFKFRNVTIYGGGKLVIPSEKGFGVASLTLRAGGITDAGEYDYVYPQFELRGTFTNSAGKFYYDYITDYDHWYHLVLPFAGDLETIKYPTEFYGTNVTADNTGSWVIKRYAGDIRATGNYKAWVDIETDNPKPTATTPGVGYIFWGAPKKVTVNGKTDRQKWGIQRITMSVTAPDAMTAENSDKAIAELSSYANVPNNSGKDNDQGWNLIGNPYMVNLIDMSTSGLHACKLVPVNDAAGNWTGKWEWNNETNIRYLTIPSEHFDTYTAKTVTQAVPLVAGRAFFVQLEGGANGITFAADNRASLMPALRAANDKPVDIETGIVLSNETLQDEVNFWIKDGKTNDYEYNADYPKTPNNNLFNIYGVHTNGDLSWVATGPEYAAESMPIGYQVPAAGTYMLSLSEIYNSDGLDALYVTDHALSPEVTVDIMSEPYEFSVNQAETNNERFTVSVRVKAKTENGATGLGNVGADGEQIHKFIYQDKMYILHHGVIYDATGKRVVTINK